MAHVVMAKQIAAERTYPVTAYVVMTCMVMAHVVMAKQIVSERDYISPSSIQF